MEILEEHVNWVKERKNGMEIHIGGDQNGQDFNEGESGPLQEWLRKQI
jgi:hypothetical protein